MKHVRKSFLNFQFMVYYTPNSGRRRAEAHSGAGEQFKAAGKKEVDGVHPGNRLPSEEKLSTMFGVSRVTIRSALKELEMEGRIFSRHGSGTYVNPMARRIAFNLAVPELYENIIRKGGRTPDVRVEGVIPEAAGEEAVSSLGVSLGETMVAVKKTFFAGDRFSMYCIDHFPREGRRCGIP